nr:EOG090X0755 [Ilyocryptus agilis]
MILQLFELREAERLTVAPSYKKKFEDFERDSRRAAEEECKRKKDELLQRLVPKTETRVDFEMRMQQREEEARVQSKLHADQIERKLRDVQTQQEKEEQAIRDELKRKALERETAEAKHKKEICTARMLGSWQKFCETSNSCRSKNTLPLPVQAKVDRIKELKTLFETSVAQRNAVDSLASATRDEKIVHEFELLVDAICNDMTNHDSEVKERERREMETLKKQATISQQTVQQTKKETESIKSTTDTLPASMSEYVHQDDLAFYTELRSELEKYEAISSCFCADTSLKDFRFTLTKATLTPMNEISDHSGSHLQEKLDRLRNLLLGNVVEVGQKRVRATQHPGGLDYCMNLLAKRLVQQGEDQVNVNPKAAFPIAAVIIELWLEFPTFGRLVLSHFYKRCPYLVPYYIPQQEGQTDEQYYRSLGYEYTAGKVEQQPAYLKRMSGVVRLYGAIMISTPRRRQPHPHGLDHAWRYLAALINLPPRNDITAGVLEVFLHVVGHAMTREYGRQFQKLLHFICTDYFAMINSVTPSGSGGAPMPSTKVKLKKSVKSIMKNGIGNLPSSVHTNGGGETVVPI